jgi:hypothetical protein
MKHQLVDKITGRTVERQSEQQLAIENRLLHLDHEIQTNRKSGQNCRFVKVWD